MTRILGYCDRISASAGSSIQVKVSCDNLEHYDANLLRVIHGDINPSGPGYREETLKLDLGGPFTGRYQPIHMGSYALVDNAPNFNPQRSLALQALIWPTLLGRGPQTILSQEDPQTQSGFSLLHQHRRLSKL